MKPIRTLLLLTTLGLVAFGAGRLSAPATASASAFSNLGLFAEVLSLVRTHYVGDVSQETLMLGAVRGLVGELDAHSAWLSPEQLAAMREDNRNEYVGVGMEIGVEEERVFVRTVFEGGPAADGGILAGDRIYRIDDESAVEWSVQEVVQHLRGRRGTPVSLAIERLDDEGNWHVHTFDLVRNIIRRTIVEASLPAPGLGHIRISGFRMNTTGEVRDAITRLRDEHGGELEGLVIDLRGNSGGLLRESITLSDLFLDRGRIVSTRGRDGERTEEWNARRNTTHYRGPLVVLVNEQSASASEIFAGALQDLQRAVVVGEPTFGKGSVQSLIDLSDGSGLKLTVSLYYTPNDRSIQQYGITPDFLVDAGEIAPAGERRTREGRLDRSIARPGDGPVLADELEGIRDRQLRAALQQLHAFRVFSESR